jgi:hypothetical protein
VNLDPAPWRTELVRVADRLEAKTKQARWTDRTEYLIERDFVAAAYAIRLLVRSYRGSGDISRRQIPVRRLEAGACYDLGLSKRAMLSIEDLCRQILNNTVFSFYCGETADLFDGVFIGPSPDEDDVILVVSSDFIALCNDLGTENV